MKFKVSKSIILLALILNYSCNQDKENCQKKKERINLCKYTVLLNCFGTNGKIDPKGPCGLYGVLTPFFCGEAECDNGLKIILPETNSEETRE